jgi:transcription initiation factor TFIIIB Brf1 subunit/transcription initiation factor TFIIB
MIIEKNLIRYYIKESLKKLNLSENVLNESEKILNKISNEEVINVPFSLKTVVATLIYVSSKFTNEKRTEREIADKLLTTEVSIRNFLRYLEGLKIW